MSNHVDYLMTLDSPNTLVAIDSIVIIHTNDFLNKNSNFTNLNVLLEYESNTIERDFSDYWSDIKIDYLNNGFSNDEVNMLDTLFGIMGNENEVNKFFDRNRNSYNGSHYEAIIGTINVAQASYQFWVSHPLEKSSGRKPTILAILGAIASADAGGYLIGWTTSWLSGEESSDARIGNGLDVAGYCSGRRALKYIRVK